MNSRSTQMKQAMIADLLAGARKAQGVQDTRPALPQFYDEIVDWRKKGRLPKPDFVPNGKRLVVLQEPPERIRGGLVIPDEVAAKYRPTVGIVVGLGTGYDPDHPEWDAWERHHPDVPEKPLWRSPYAVGDRIVWGRFHGDLVVKTTVKDDWWDEGEERGDGGIPVIIIHTKDVLGFAEGVDASAMTSTLTTGDDG